MTGAPPPAEGRRAALRLGGYSFVILFLELALIRYLPGYVRVFGFYLNFVLIAAFLGMGVGLLKVEDAARVRWLALPALLALFGVTNVFANVVVEQPVDPNELLWGIFTDIAPSVRRIGILPVTVLLFTLTALLFVPLGALMGREFRKFPPLTAYSIDIAGSLLGILAFGVASALWLPPVAWFAVALGAWTALAWPSRPFGPAFAAAAAVSLTLAYWPARANPGRWSPYYRIAVSRTAPGAYSLDVNGSFHQYMLDFTPEATAQDAALATIRGHYLRPLAAVSSFDTVLVLGAGTGNDVALLLEAGASYIDAVEIDPAILDLGERLHFQKPYADPRVRAHVDDARAFLRHTTRRYDLIVLGTLDSQTLLSAMSSLRLDNYMYTVEAFRDMRARLKPGGQLVAYHMSGRPFVAAKIYRAIEDAWGAGPLVFFEPDHILFNFTYVTGATARPGEVSELPRGVSLDVAPPRDDWPYLYLRRATVPRHYVVALGAVLLIAGGLVAWGGGRQLATGFDASMFFMGLGFLLIETKSVTEMSLLFGSTWTVNLLVFSAILTVILLANLLVLKEKPLPLHGLFLALFASLILGLTVSARDLLWLGTVGQWVLGGGLVGLPIFFAALIFATLFRTRAATTRALGYNLLGAIVGGVLEYLSMAIGVKGLYLVAALGYGAAFLTSVPRPAVASSGPG